MDRKMLFGLWIMLLGWQVGACDDSRGPEYDYAIVNGAIIAGDGNPWFRADVGIKGDRIHFIGAISTEQAKRVIDAQGYYVCPGFVDIHNHADEILTRIPSADNYLLQGVTTVVGGNCGEHPYPLRDLFLKIQSRGTAINFCSLVGHNTIRKTVMGMKMADPTSGEMLKMKQLLGQEMRAGGMGLSTGLAYMPGRYSKTQELIDLGGVVSQYGGLYASHIRNQGEGITQAIEEAIRIGEENRMRVQISHVKLARDSIWGKLAMITTPVEQARQRGVEVTLDQYPYTATSSGFSSSFPAWCLEGGKEEFVKRLENPDNYQKIKQVLIDRRLSSTKGIDKLETIFIAAYEKDPGLEGKNLKQILLSRKKEVTLDNAVDLIIEIEKSGKALGVFFQMDEADVERIMALDYNMIASDGEIIEFGRGVPELFARTSHQFANGNSSL